MIGASAHDAGTQRAKRVRGAGGTCGMREIQQIERRTWLAWMATGTWAVWSELTGGRGRPGWRIALGGADLATRVVQAQTRAPVHALRVITDFVNAYVLVRGKEIAWSIPACPIMVRNLLRPSQLPGWAGRRWAMCS